MFTSQAPGQPPLNTTWREKVRGNPSSTQNITNSAIKDLQARQDTTWCCLDRLTFTWVTVRRCIKNFEMNCTSDTAIQMTCSMHTLIECTNKIHCASINVINVIDAQKWMGSH